MNLNNFEAYFDDTILARGLDYFKSGNVIYLGQDIDQWLARVAGSDDYNVTVTLSENGEILDSECDCPYDWGDYCKHQAAVFYALRNRLKSGKIPTTTVQKESLEDTLTKLDKQTLLSIILEIANKDRSIREKISLRYAEKEDTLKSAKSVIKNAINAVKRRGFVEYRDTGRAV